jgi:dynein heavy chain
MGKAMNADDNDEQPQEDVDIDPDDRRVLWVKQRIQFFLGLFDVIDEYWQGFLETRMHKVYLHDFLEKEAPPTLLFWVTNKKLVAQVDASEVKQITKAVYFIKKEAAVLEEEHLDSGVLFGELGKQSLGHVKRLLNAVLLPMLSHPPNQKHWPSVVVDEINRSCWRFLSSVRVVESQMEGKQQLPMPMEAELEEGQIELEGEAGDALRKETKLSMIRTLEQYVVEWAEQAHAVLDMDPDAILGQRLRPGPIVELDYWKHRSVALLSIKEQLASEQVSKVAQVLEAVQSNYHHVLHR